MSALKIMKTNEGFLALEPDEERGGNAFAKPAKEKGLAEAQAAEG